MSTQVHARAQKPFISLSLLIAFTVLNVDAAKHCQSKCRKKDTATQCRETRDESGNLRVQVRSCVGELIPFGQSFGEPSEQFFGLHTGDVSSDMAVIQVGYEPESQTFPDLLIRLFVRDDNCVFRAFGISDLQGPMPDTQYYRWTIEGLEPGREYNYYAYDPETNTRSEIGRFVTPANKNATNKNVKFALTSCYGAIDQNRTNTAHLNKLWDEKPDFMLQLGDLCYVDLHIPLEDVSPVRPDLVQGMIYGLPFRPALTLQEAQNLWKNEVWRVSNIARGSSSTAMFSIIDDHDYFNNFPTIFMRPALSPDAVAINNYWDGYPLDTARENVAEVWALDDLPTNYFEDLDKAYSDAVVRITDGNKKYFYKQWGDIDLIVLDDIFDRVQDDPAGIKLISDEQMAWLKGVLKLRKNSIKLVCASKPIDMQIEAIFGAPNVEAYYNSYLEFFLFLAADIGAPESAAQELAAFYTASDMGDYWMYYSNYNTTPIPYLSQVVPQTNEILDFIKDEGINGVLFVGGDYHITALAQTSPEPKVLPLTFDVGPVGSQALSGYAEIIPFDDTVFYNIVYENHTIVEYDACNKKLTFKAVGTEQETSFDLFLDDNFNVKSLSECRKMKCDC